MYALIIPVLPFALVERVQIHHDDVQQWIGILLAAYGAGLLVGSRKFPIASCIGPPSDGRLLMPSSDRRMVRGPWQFPSRPLPLGLDCLGRFHRRLFHGTFEIGPLCGKVGSRSLVG